MNLGIFNMRHSLLPRIASFDDVKLRRMILHCSSPQKGVEDYSAATVNSGHANLLFPPSRSDINLLQVRDADQICYTRSAFDTKADIMTPGIYSQKPPEAKPKGLAGLHNSNHAQTRGKDKATVSAQVTPTHNREACPDAVQFQTPITTVPGANDFANCMKDNFPLLVRHAIFNYLT
jgi:hypothetical protein